MCVVVADNNFACANKMIYIKKNHLYLRDIEVCQVNKLLDDNLNNSIGNRFFATRCRKLALKTCFLLNFSRRNFSVENRWLF